MCARGLCAGAVTSWACLPQCQQMGRLGSMDSLLGRLSVWAGQLLQGSTVYICTYIFLLTDLHSGQPER